MTTTSINPEVLRDVSDATGAALAARDAIQGASRRRAQATATAQHMIDNALAIEKAEKDAARAELAASIRRLGAEAVPVDDIADLCDMPPDSVRALIDRPTVSIERVLSGDPAPGPVSNRQLRGRRRAPHRSFRTPSPTRAL